MGWKTINKRRYYYRSKRVGKRVESTYCGGETSAADAAYFDTCDRIGTMEERAARAEEREQADAILGSLLAGTLDNDPELSPLARKVKGYRSCSIKSQRIVRDGAADFRGVLDSPTGRACFDMTLVRQVSGRWTVGTFSGPHP